MTAKRIWFRRAVGAAVIMTLAAVGSYVGAAGANHTHSDVSNSNPFHDEIAWLTDPNHQIASGFPNGTFKPQDAVKRQQLAFWMANFNDAFYLREATATMPANGPSVLASDVFCFAGSRALSGGGSANISTRAFIEESAPISGDTGWRIRYETDDSNSMSIGDTVTAFVLCGPELAP